MVGKFTFCNKINKKFLPGFLTARFPECQVSLLPGFLTARFPDCQVSWLSGFLTARFPDCQVSWLSGFLTVRFPDCQVSWLPGFLTARPPDCQVSWLPGFLTCVRISAQFVPITILVVLTLTLIEAAGAAEYRKLPGIDQKQQTSAKIMQVATADIGGSADQFLGP